MVKKILICFIMLLLSGCYKDLSVGQNKNYAEELIGETREITVTAPKKDFYAIFTKNTKLCKDAGCVIIDTAMQTDSLGANAKLKALIHRSNFNNYRDSLNQNPLKIKTYNNITNNAYFVKPDIAKRLEEQKVLKASMIDLLGKSQSNFIEIMSIKNEISTLQNQIELASAILQIPANQQTPNSIEASQASKAVNPSELVLIDVNFTADVWYAPILRAAQKFKDIIIDSASEAILFLAYTLPWIPAAIILMWLISIALKKRINVSTSMPAKAKVKKQEQIPEKKVISEPNL